MRRLWAGQWWILVWIFAVNPAACALTGYIADELLAMRIIDLLPPDGTDEALDHVRRLLEHGQAVGDMRYRTRSGTVRWWTVQAVRLGSDRFLGFCEDITQRRAAETEVAHLTDMLTAMASSRHSTSCQTGGPTILQRPDNAG